MTDRHREHRISSSLDRVTGKAPTGEAELRAMAARVLKSGVILFLRADLEQLPWTSREIIEGEARKLYGHKAQ